jgi:hypothetical protein
VGAFRARYERSAAGRTFSEYRTTDDMNTGRICTSGTGCSTGGRNLLDFFETAMDANGCVLTTFTDNITKTPYVSFVRQTGGPGLLRDQECGPVPLAATTPTEVRRTGKPSGGVGSLAATGASSALILMALALLGVGLLLRRR